MSDNEDKTKKIQIEPGIKLNHNKHAKLKNKSNAIYMISWFPPV